MNGYWMTMPPCLWLWDSVGPSQFNFTNTPNFPAENEAEVSFFNRVDYAAFQASPEVSRHQLGGLADGASPKKIKWE